MSTGHLRHPACIAGIVVAIFVADVFTGPYILFPVTFVIPIWITAWHYGHRWGIGLSTALCLCRFLVVCWLEPEIFGGEPWIALTNATIRGVVLGLLAWLVARVSSQVRLLSQRVQVLEGLLPICSFCKNIRDDAGTWVAVEQFVAERSGAKFSHGVCVPCAKLHYPELTGR